MSVLLKEVAPWTMGGVDSRMRTQVIYRTISYRVGHVK